MKKHGKLELGTSRCDCGNAATELVKVGEESAIAVCDECKKRHADDSALKPV